MKKNFPFFIALLLLLTASSSFSQAAFTVDSGASIVTTDAVTIDYGGGN